MSRTRSVRVPIMKDGGPVPPKFGIDDAGDGFLALALWELRRRLMKAGAEEPFWTVLDAAAHRLGGDSA